ncbi:MAG: response regulator transcription factor [Terracoccus sp.]
MARVMIVDDEDRIRVLLTKSLTSEGHSVVSVATVSAAIACLESEQIDLVLLDLVMPGGSGLSVLKTMRARDDPTPVIVLSGVTEIGARVQSLDLGAVDFVAKPFSLTELLARVRRNVARSHPTAPDRFIEAGGIRVDLERRRASFRDVGVALTEREFSLLVHLAHRPGLVCRREELLRDVWQLDFDPGSNVIEVCVGRLRSKLGQDIPIETVRRVGYCLYED